jgi:Response regulator containing a CheY-like receiver domain and an HTH DNA-binding domain
MIKVHITEDHKMLIEGLEKTINESGIATVTGFSHNLEESRKALALETPDVLLLDISLPDGNGIDFCLEVRQKYPKIKILALTSHDEYSVAKQVIDNGASGYILKNTLSKEVIAGIEAVMNGEIFLCEEIDVLMKKEANNEFWLTKREMDLLKLIADGYTNQEAADDLFLSIETIKSYRKNLIFKLGARNSMALVKIAIEKKLI